MAQSRNLFSVASWGWSCLWFEADGETFGLQISSLCQLDAPVAAASQKHGCTEKLPSCCSQLGLEQRVTHAKKIKNKNKKIEKIQCKLKHKWATKMKPSSVRYGAKWCVHELRHSLSAGLPLGWKLATLRTKMEINIITITIINSPDKILPLCESVKML